MRGFRFKYHYLCNHKHSAKRNTMQKTLIFLLICVATLTQLQAQDAAKSGSNRSGANATISADSNGKPAVRSRSDVAPSPTTTKKKTTTVKKTTTTTTVKKTTTIPARTVPKGSSTTKKTEKTKSVKNSVPINWLTLDQIIEKSKTEKRKIFVDVYTDWCGWCRHMDSTTFADPKVAAYINEKFYALKFNAEQTGDIVFKEKTYKFIKEGKGGHHELAALWLNNRMSYPTSVFLDEDLNLIQPLPNYQDATKMDIILHYFGTDNHKKTPWEKYEKNYGKEQ